MKLRMTTVLVVFLCCCRSHGETRVAIIGSQETAKLMPLLELRLGQNKEIVLLEREKIEAIIRERRLQELLSPEAAAQRVGLGRLLKARVLVVLRSGAKQETPCVDLVVCETERGLRLLTRTVPLSTRIESDAATVADMVERAIGRKAGPIREIYAVPPFLSRNLAYDRDYLRSAYAGLMEQMLLEQPGTLVVELAEAEVIGREVALSGETPTRRAPCFVLGEYRHEGAGETARVRITLKLRRGEKQLAEAAATVRTDATTEFFRQSLAVFAKAAGSEPRPSYAADHDDEIRQLVCQAEDHARLGDWNEALALAEAALVLKPDKLEMHRLALVAITGVLGGGHQGDLAKLIARRQYYRRGLDHLEAVIRFGKPEDYQQPGGETVVGRFLRCHTTYIEAALPQEVKELEETAQREHREALMRVARFFAQRGEMEPALHYCRISTAALDPRQQYAEILKMILEFQDVPGQAAWIRHGAQGPYTLDVLDAAEGREFLVNLMASPSAKTDTKQIAKALQKAAERAVAQQAREAAAPRAKTPPVELSQPGIRFRPIDLRATVVGNVNYPIRRARCIPAGDGVDFFWDSKSLFLMKTKGLLMRVRDEIHAGHVDQYPGSTYLNLHPVFDGRYLWVIAQPPPLPQVIVIDPVTERVWELGKADGLPLPKVAETPTAWEDYRVLAVPWRPGEVCMAGSFGRTWIAMVRFDPDGPCRVRVFHEAREVQKHEDREQWKKTAVAFYPSFMSVLQGGRDAAGKPVRRVLLGRGDSQHTANFDLFYHPLLVDPEQQSVEVVQQKLETPQDYVDHDGAIYGVAPVAERPKELAVQRIGLPDLTPTPVVTIPKDGRLVFDGDRLNVVGKQWWSGLVSDHNLVSLGNVPWCYSDRWSMSANTHVVQPEEYHLDWLGRSNHYGVLARFYHGRDPADSPAGSIIAQVLIGDRAVSASGKAENPTTLAGQIESANTPSDGRQTLSFEQKLAKFPPSPQLAAAAARFRPNSIQITDATRTQKVMALMSPSGKYLAVGTDKGVTILWSLTSKAAAHVLAGHERQIELLSFSPDETRLATYGLEGTAKVRDVESGEEILQISDRNLRKVTRVLGPYGDTSLPLVVGGLGWKTIVFSPDGKLLVTKNPLVTQFWNLDSKKLDYCTSMFAQVGEFLPDGTLLALIADSHRSLIAWDSKTRGIRQLVREPCGQILALSSDGKRVALRESFQTVDGRLIPSCRVAVWDLPHNAMIGIFDGQPGAVSGEANPPKLAAFSPDGTILTVGFAGGMIRVWKIAPSGPR